jgi:hypothetical protein
MEVSRRSWIIEEGNEPCGAWWRIKEARRRSYDMSGRNLGRK